MHAIYETVSAELRIGPITADNQNLWAEVLANLKTNEALGGIKTNNQTISFDPLGAKWSRIGNHYLLSLPLSSPPNQSTLAHLKADADLRAAMVDGVGYIYDYLQWLSETSVVRETPKDLEALSVISDWLSNL